MTQKSVKILNSLTNAKNTRQERLTDLLRNPEIDYTNDWYMCVPSCFNDALDIKKTDRVIISSKKSDNGQSVMTIKNTEKVWTQGSYFSFDKGDTLYNSPEAYNSWNKALKNIKLCIQIDNATANSPSKDGIVTFLTLTPNEQYDRLVERLEHTMSQNDFVRFLIEGPSGEFKDKLKKFIDFNGM